MNARSLILVLAVIALPLRAEPLISDDELQARSKAVAEDMATLNAAILVLDKMPDNEDKKKLTDAVMAGMRVVGEKAMQNAQHGIAKAQAGIAKMGDIAASLDPQKPKVLTAEEAVARCKLLKSEAAVILAAGEEAKRLPSSPEKIAILRGLTAGMNSNGYGLEGHTSIILAEAARLNAEAAASKASR